VCLDDIRNWVVNRRIMLIHQTLCDIDLLVFQHTLAKSQYQTSRAFNKKNTLLEIYVTKLKVVLDEEISNIKITKPQVKATGDVG
jgi:hypothetical protein